MTLPAWIKPLFLFAAIYDGLLGLAFLAVPLRIYAWMNVPPPNHLGYIQFPAALLIIFAYAFWLIALDEPFAQANSPLLHQHTNPCSRDGLVNVLSPCH